VVGPQFPFSELAFHPQNYCVPISNVFTSTPDAKNNRGCCSSMSLAFDTFGKWWAILKSLSRHVHPSERNRRVLKFMRGLFERFERIVRGRPPWTRREEQWRVVGMCRLVHGPRHSRDTLPTTLRSWYTRYSLAWFILESVRICMSGYFYVYN
jgi:hypothetical protein